MRRRQVRAKLNRNADQGNGRLLRGAHIRCSEEGFIMAGEKVNLLIADDEPPIRRAFSEIFAEFGCSVRSAEDGFTALVAINTGPIFRLNTRTRVEHAPNAYQREVTREASTMSSTVRPGTLYAGTGRLIPTCLLHRHRLRCNTFSHQWAHNYKMDVCI